MLIDGADVLAGATIRAIADAWHMRLEPARDHYGNSLRRRAPRARSAATAACPAAA